MHPLPLASWSCGVLAGTGLALTASEPVAPRVALGVLGFGVGVLALAILGGARSQAGAGRRATRTGRGAVVSGRWLGMLLAFAGAALAAWGTTQARALDRLGDRLSPALEARDLWWLVRIDEMPSWREEGVRLRVQPQPTALLPPQSPCAGRAEPGAAGTSLPDVPARLQIHWYATAAGPPPSTLEAGQLWCLPLKLKRPHGPINPVGFDVELWLFEQDIGATGAVRGSVADRAHLVAQDGSRPVERARQHLRDAIHRHVGERTAAGVLAALAVGDQAGIDLEVAN